MHERAKTVLVVEDNSALYEPLKHSLTKGRKGRVQVVGKGSGNEAIDYLLRARDEGRRVDLVILDIRMPKKRRGPIERTTGAQLLLNTNYFHLIDASCPVLIFTENANYEECVQCIKAGAFDYIPKRVRYGPATEIRDELGDWEATNFDILIDRCEYLLLLREAKEPRDLWVEANATRLSKEHSGLVLGVFELRAAREAGRKERDEGGYVVIPFADPDALASFMIRDARLRWEPFYYIDARRPKSHAAL